jgi:hypothetical protein
VVVRQGEDIKPQLAEIRRDLRVGPEGNELFAGRAGGGKGGFQVTKDDVAGLQEVLDSRQVLSDWNSLSKQATRRHQIADR